MKTVKNEHRETWKEFLERKEIRITPQTYLIDALGAMAFGLFASLLIGTIFSTLGEKCGVGLFLTIANYAKSATGAALGVSIAYALKAPQLVLFSAAAVGIAGNELGGPVGALVAAVISTELGKLVSKETRVDILVTPGVTIITGGSPDTEETGTLIWTDPDTNTTFFLEGALDRFDLRDMAVRTEETEPQLSPPTKRAQSITGTAGGGK